VTPSLRWLSFLWASVTVSSAASLPQDVYVWQRGWTPPVTNAVISRAPHFGELIALQAEVAWHQNTPSCIKVDLDYAALRQTGKPIGLALRIGVFFGTFATKDSRTVYLASLSRELVSEAKAHDLQPVELQLDFDCAESKLDGYCVWLKAVQNAVRPLPVTITALPSWLNQPAFDRLARTADGYVLQVHSFERPTGPDAPFELCNPQAARRAAKRAAAIGRPFRVALPTYGYLVAFDTHDAFLGLSAEGPGRDWPEDAKLREFRANPTDLSLLVREWSTNRPVELSGLIWYRLPVESDVMNWSWPTLQSVMAGHVPASDISVGIRRVQAGLFEIDLVNEGAADAGQRYSIQVYWKDARRIAADGVHGYSIAQTRTNTMDFDPPQRPDLLRAGERRTIGWIRFATDPELEAELHEAHD